MLLAVDIGNTSTTFGVFDADRLVSHFRLSTNRAMSDDELAILLMNLLQLGGVEQRALTGVIVCSVVPELDYAYRSMCDRYMHLVPTFVTRATPTGMPILYRNPEEVGADRIVNAVGAFGRWPGGLIVVDLGTALTFDVVSPRGEYLGGSIAPGLRIAVDALFQRTSKLPRIDLVPPDHALGTTTVESIRSGIFYGFAGLIDGNVNALRRELDFPAKVVGTGGHIFLMRGLSATLEDCDEFLTLNGLRVIATRIQGA